MENGGISTLDNIVVCGEDDSENLILSFYGTFPEANVSRLDFSDIDITELDKETKESISAFSVPIAAATDLFDEIGEAHKGINLLPRYVKEDQKFLQFGWHGYLMLPVLFVATLFITQQVLKNQKEIGQLNDDIATQKILIIQNQEILTKISDLEGRINNFGATQTILDSVSVGAGVWSHSIGKISNFFQGRKNVWLTKMNLNETGRVFLEGYSLTKNVLTDFAYEMNKAELKTVFFEALRDKNAYKFTMDFDLNSYQKVVE